MDNMPDDVMQDMPIGGDAPDPTLFPALSSLAPDADTVSAPPAGDAPTGSQTPPEDTAPVHTFQVTHIITSPERYAGRSVFTSAELTVDEAIAWIRQRLLES